MSYHPTHGHIHGIDNWVGGLHYVLFTRNPDATTSSQMFLQVQSFLFV